MGLKIYSQPTGTRPHDSGKTSGNHSFFKVTYFACYSNAPDTCIASKPSSHATRLLGYSVLVRWGKQRWHVNSWRAPAVRPPYLTWRTLLIWHAWTTLCWRCKGLKASWSL